jgi:hypothetical protein
VILTSELPCWCGTPSRLFSCKHVVSLIESTWSRTMVTWDSRDSLISMVTRKGWLAWYPRVVYYSCMQSRGAGHIWACKDIVKVFSTIIINATPSPWCCVVDLPRYRHGYQLPINHQHTSYANLSVHCAFEEGFVGLRFVFDALTTDNLTGIRQKWKQSVPRYSTNLRRIFEWVRQKIDGEKIFGSSGFAVNSTSNSRWPLH